MKNSEKAQLRADVRELSKEGYSQKEGIKILKEYGYCDSTARMYWKCFSNKLNLITKEFNKEGKE